MATRITPPEEDGLARAYGDRPEAGGTYDGWLVEFVGARFVEGDREGWYVIVEDRKLSMGQALYAGMAARVGVDPNAQGSQRAILDQCEDIVMQPHLSAMKSGKRGASQELAEQLCERFGLELVPPSQMWGVRLVSPVVEGGEQ